MRGVKFLLPFLVALAAAGCARQQQQAYYIIDPQTGQPVPVVHQAQPQPYGQAQYAPPSYEQPAAQPQYAQPQYAQPQYAQAPATPSANARGLFSRSPAYAQQSYQTYQAPAYQPQPQYAASAYQPAEPQQPAYVAQPQPQRAQAQPSSGRGLFTRPRSPAYSQQPAYVQPQYGAGGPYVAAPAPAATQAYAAPSNYQPSYTLDSGDKLRIVVFGQEGITNSYLVGVDGSVNLPLIGAVPARGFSTQQLSQMIAERLKQGYVREPHVSVEIETYRPFFILGEVTTPGQYPYVANMTAEKAIAIAGGFSPRANKRTVEVTRNAPGQQFKGDVPLNYPLRPGDTVLVKERWF
jgi:polysaccharide export outer membrane protein